jgi:hypothetical protein
MYWEKREDTMNIMVKKAMSKGPFSNIITDTSFTMRTEPDHNDRYWKVHPCLTSTTALPKSESGR